MSSYKGFTLSEILVTMGIIGVVAAMTVPTLMQNAQRRIFATSLKKVYSELSQALQNAKTERNVQKWSETRVNGEELFTKYLKTTYRCTSVSNVMSTSFKNYQGNKGKITENNSNKYYCATLKDGASVCIKQGIGPQELYVDTNGKQGPDIGGRDIFHLYINGNGEVVGYAGYQNIDGQHNTGTTINADTAFSYLLNNGWEMDY